MAGEQLLPWIDSGDAEGNRNSMQNFAGNGSTTSWDFNFAGGYIDATHVKAYIYRGASGLTDAVDPVVLTGPNTIEVIPAVPTGDFLVVYRDTPKDQPLVNYVTGAVLDEANLDKSNQQAVFATAEMADRFDAINASSADAIERSFAAYEIATEALDASGQAATDAAAAAASAAAAAVSAAEAVTTANEAHDIATGIDAKAQEALDNSESAITIANSSVADATEALATANEALDIASQATMPATGGTFTGPVYGLTPAPGDNSTQLATTAFVQAALSTALVGQVVWEARTAARAGFLKLNGAVLNRADYPALWAYAQASGALVTDATWSANRFACFSDGDGSTTFRVPEVRGEFLRCWDEGRGADAGRSIGSWQDSANRSHTHGAGADTQGYHAHSAWTDAQGYHAHGVYDPGHVHFGALQTFSPGGQGASGSPNFIQRINTDGSGTGIGIYADGSHGHNVGIGGDGSHSHNITVYADGAGEARGRNIALLAMIRAF